MEKIKNWRLKNPEKRKIQKTKERLKRRCRDLGILPKNNILLNDEQIDIINKINNGQYKSTKEIPQIMSLLDKERAERNKIRNIIENKILKRIKANSRLRNTENEKLDIISIEDIVIPQKCPYFNENLSTDPNSPYYYSIDRIDSTKGYVKGNVQIISKKANIMKNDSSIDELIKFAKGVLKIHNK